MPFAPPNLLILLNGTGFESHSLRQFIENKQLIMISKVRHAPLVALVFVFGMSVMQFCPAPVRPIKPETN